MPASTVRDGVAGELETWLEKRLDDSPIDRLLRAHGPDRDEASRTASLGERRGRDAREHATHRRLTHRRQKLLRGERVALQRVVAFGELLADGIELVAGLRERLRSALDTPERSGWRAPGTRRTDEAKRFRELGAELPQRPRMRHCTDDTRRDALSRDGDAPDVIDQPIDGLRRHPDGAVLCARLVFVKTGRPTRRTQARTLSSTQGRQRSFGIVEEPAEDRAILRDLLQRRLGGVARFASRSDALLETVTEPRHRLVARSAGRALHRVDVAENVRDRLERIALHAERIVDLR
jgi:hypothetical protein